MEHQDRTVDIPGTPWLALHVSRWMRGILILAIAAAGVLAFAEHGDRRAARTAGPWERTLAPADGLSGLDAVRVGGRVVVVGGADYSQSRVKAIVFDTGSGRWSRAARSPLAWRAGHSVVAAKGEVIVWGGAPGAGAAAYDVSADSWRRIPPGLLRGRFRHSAVWTGDEMIVFAGRDRRGTRSDGAAFDPRSGRWRRIASSPLSPRADHAAVWTGREVIVWGGSRPAGGGRDHVLSDGAAYDPRSDLWRRLAPPPIRSAPTRVLGQGVEVDIDAVWTGTRMLVWNGFVGAAYAPRRNRWTPLPPPPDRMRHWKPHDSAVWTGRRLIVFGGTARDNHADFIADAAAYDPARARWTTLPPAPIAGRDRHAAVWTGRAMLVIGGCCRGSRHHRDGALYCPR